MQGQSWQSQFSQPTKDELNTNIKVSF
jgi:hypothetical protein